MPHVSVSESCPNGVLTLTSCLNVSSCHWQCCAASILVAAFGGLSRTILASRRAGSPLSFLPSAVNRTVVLILYHMTTLCDGWSWSVLTYVLTPTSISNCYALSERHLPCHPLSHKLISTSPSGFIVGATSTQKTSWKAQAPVIFSSFFRAQALLCSSLYSHHGVCCIGNISYNKWMI